LPSNTTFIRYYYTQRDGKHQNTIIVIIIIITITIELAVKMLEKRMGRSAVNEKQVLLVLMQLLLRGIHSEPEITKPELYSKLQRENKIWIGEGKRNWIIWCYMYRKSIGHHRIPVTLYTLDTSIAVSWYISCVTVP
jgi:peptidoglycan biosynthesis protein MviN/MurJ (putative lipid II flippase)